MSREFQRLPNDLHPPAQAARAETWSTLRLGQPTPLDDVLRDTLRV